MQAPAPDAPTSHLTAVLGAKGGCGSTFIAVNLAAELARGDTVGLVDLDLAKGDVAGFLDLWPERSLSDLLPQLGQLDPALVRGLATHLRSGVHLLPQPAQLADAHQLSADEARLLLAGLRSAWPRVVCDCGGRVSPVGLAAALAADRVLLVLTPDVHALRDARRVLTLLESVGVPRARVEPVVNRMPGRPQVPLDLIEEELRQAVQVVLPLELSAAGEADVAGKPLREVAPLSALTSGLRALAQGAAYHPRPRLLQWRRA